MKYIFDFDDVLFNDTTQFKKHMYLCLEKAGIPSDMALKYYKEMREKGFSLKKFISSLLARQKIKHINAEDLHEKIMKESKNFLNTKLIKEIKKIGKSNCYILSFGDIEHQMDKIKRTNLNKLFYKIIVIKKSKKESIEKICARHKKEKIIFIDDKIKNFADLDFKKCPNLQTVLYTGQSFSELIQKK